MRSRAAKAASGVAALFLGFGLMQIGIQRHAPAGHRESSQAILAASVPSASERLLSALSVREAERVETERLEAERVEAERAAEEEAQREVERLAAERTEKVRRAAEVAKTTPTTVRPAPVALTPASRPTGSMPPDYIKQCESGGSYTAVNPNGHYGAWQFSQSTWESVGGTGRPDQASPAEQDYRASILWAGGRGASHWECA